MQKNAQGDFWQPRSTKNTGKSIWALDDKEKRMEVDLGIHGQQKMY
jgi:hypothetical protein